MNLFFLFASADRCSGMPFEIASANLTGGGKEGRKGEEGEIVNDEDEEILKRIDELDLSKEQRRFFEMIIQTDNRRKD